MVNFNLKFRLKISITVNIMINPRMAIIFFYGAKVLSKLDHTYVKKF